MSKIFTQEEVDEARESWSHPNTPIHERESVSDENWNSSMRFDSCLDYVLLSMGVIVPIIVVVGNLLSKK